MYSRRRYLLHQFSSEKVEIIFNHEIDFYVLFQYSFNSVALSERNSHFLKIVSVFEYRFLTLNLAYDEYETTLTLTTKVFENEQTFIRRY